MAGEEERVEWGEKELEQRSRQKATLSMSVEADASSPNSPEGRSLSLPFSVEF